MEDFPPTLVPQTSLRDALAQLEQSPLPTLQILEPDTGRVLAVLTRWDAESPAISFPLPPRLGGLATPLGVYLHDGVSSGGAGFWGLFLTGVTFSGLALAANLLTLGALHFAGKLPIESVRQWLPLPLIFLLLRLVPMSGTHAAEHQVVHCVERSAPLVPEVVRMMPRVHPRCGTNIVTGFTLFLLLFTSAFSALQRAGWMVADSATLSLMLAAPITLVGWRRLGGVLQQWFATKPATDGQIAGAIRAAEQVLTRRQAALALGRRPRFAPVLRVWRMGLLQVMLGYAAVSILLTLIALAFPRLTGFLQI